MSQGGQEVQGTGLRDVFDILVKATSQRLLSLTFQLGESPEDNIVHALCLIILQKEERALNKLQMLKGNYLAKHITEKWQNSGGKLDDFAIQCGQDLPGETLSALARIFKVLSEQRLCDSHLRNLAYKRALSSDGQRTSNCEDLEYDQLREEAKVVCGPEFAEMMCFPKDLKSGSYRDPLSSLGGGSTNFLCLFELSQDQSASTHSLPSPLQVTSSMPSYPTHLEISIPPTASFQGDKMTPAASGESKQHVRVSECEAPRQSHTSENKSSQPPVFGANKPSKTDQSLTTESSLIVQSETLNQTTKPTTGPNFALPAATNIFLPKIPALDEMHESRDAEEEEEATFYAFVILHAPEDADMAESMREKLETILESDSEGATFSGDFALPGKSTLRCVEDAISNSAFTILLLTRNFNTRLLEMKTDSALINSINKKYKHNTVIPLLPRENSMPRHSLPMVLQTIIPLVEDKSFTRKIQKALSPAKIRNQKKFWTGEQREKMQIERQERLKHLNQHQRQLIRECTAAELLEKEKLSLYMEQKILLMQSQQDGGDGGGQWQHQQPNIHINNAKYIMIGNDSRMNVDLSGGPDTEDSIYREEEQ